MAGGKAKAGNYQEEFLGIFTSSKQKYSSRKSFEVFDTMRTSAYQAVQ